MSKAEENYRWILDNQILPNQRGLKRVALVRAIAELQRLQRVEQERDTLRAAILTDAQDPDALKDDIKALAALAAAHASDSHDMDECEGHPRAAIKELAALRAGLQQVIAEMRESAIRDTDDFEHESAFTTEQWLVRVQELLAGLTATQGNAQHSSSEPQA